ncbi:hypothetical protein ALO69_200063 [Pseudomonas ficuserectae]|nr:hypothetical protein ALO69_200063 [Pseudomonas ficuserectae]
MIRAFTIILALAITTIFNCDRPETFLLIFIFIYISSCLAFSDFVIIDKCIKPEAIINNVLPKRWALSEWLLSVSKSLIKCVLALYLAPMPLSLAVFVLGKSFTHTLTHKLAYLYPLAFVGFLLE